MRSEKKFSLFEILEILPDCDSRYFKIPAQAKHSDMPAFSKPVKDELMSFRNACRHVSSFFKGKMKILKNQMK